MDNQFKTSFIPKKPIPVSGTAARTGRPHNLFSILAGLIFLVVLILAGGVFAWKILLQRNITKLDAEKEEARATFDPVLLDQLERLDQRIETTKRLLGDHLAFSAFFDALGSITLKSVGYSSFSYSQNGSKVAVTLDGEAESFAALALQADTYAASRSIISSPVLSNVVLQNNGFVTFTLSATANPTLISFKKNVVQGPDVPAADAGTQDATTTEATSTTP